LCFGERAPELAFEHAVNAANFLLLAQMNTVVGHALAGFLAMLAWSGFQFALGVERATRAFQEQVSAFPSR
jgi:hypothetical protein